MGFTTSNLSLYHTFSKTPVDSNTNSAAAQLGNAINKSGHTVQSNEIWTESIPFFGLAATTTAIHNKFSATAKVNDLVKDSDGKIWQRNSTAYSASANFADLWSEKTKSITSFTKGADGKYTFTEANGALVDGSYLLNSEGVPTVKYYEKRLLTRLTADNNANTNSDNKASRLQIDGKWIDQFIGVTDIYVNGSAAVSYAPVLRKTASSSPMQAGPGKGYMDYCATGLILWESSAAGTEVIDCFEYVGAKLDATVAKLSAAVFGSGSTGDEDLSLSEQVTANTTAINVLKGADTVDGSVAKSIKTAIENLGDVAVKGDIKISEIKVKSGSTTTTLTPDSNKSVTVEIPEVQAATTSVAGVVTISDNDAIATTETSTAAATVAAVAATRSTIVSELGALAVSVNSNKTEVDGKISAIEGKLASTGEIGQAIAGVKATADSAVQSVTRATGSSTLLTVTDGTDVTISLSTEVATKSDAATAAANAVTTGLATGGNIAQAIAAAKSGAEQTAATALSTARGEITTEISTAVSGLKTELTTGDGSLGAKVAALETATGTTLPAAIEQALTDAKAYSDSLHTTSLDYVVLGDSESLPTASADTLGKIYLVASQNAPTSDGSAISGSYVEYMTRKVSDTQYTWEKIGTTEADLSAYAKAADLNATNVGSGAVKVSQTNGVVSSVTVATEALVNNGAIKTSVTDANALVKASDALAAIKLAKPASYIKSVKVEKSNSSSGEIDLKVTHFGGWDGTKMIFDEGTKSIGPSYHSAGKLAGYVLKGPEKPVGFCNNTLIWDDETSDHFGFVYGNFLANNTYNTTSRDWFINTDKLVYLDNSGVFANNENLKFFKSNLDNVIDANRAFYNTSLSEFIVDMPSCETADEMFACWDGPTTLTTFIGDLSNLKKAKDMFKDQHNLRTFISDLSSLAVGKRMFSGCSLDTESVECIADTINTNISTSNRPLDGYGVIHIDIANTEPNAREIEAFNTIHSYNWELYVNGSLYNPTEPAAIATTDENGVTRTTPIPFYAKAVEVSEEENAEYIDNTGKFYHVLGGQYIYVNDPETYGMFTCLEDAVANMRLTKYVKPEVEA